MNRRKAEPIVFEGLRAGLRMFRWVILLLFVLFWFSGIQEVDPDKVGLLLRFGHLQGKTPATQVRQLGLLLALPYPIDRVFQVPSKQEGEVVIKEVWKGIDDTAQLERSLEVPLTLWERGKIAIQLGSAMLASGLLAGEVFQPRFGPPEMSEIADLIMALAACVVTLPLLISATRGLLGRESHSFGDQLVALSALAAMATGNFVTATLIPVIMSLGHFLEERSILGAQAAIEGLGKLHARKGDSGDRPWRRGGGAPNVAIR